MAYMPMECDSNFHFSNSPCKYLGIIFAGYVADDDSSVGDDDGDGGGLSMSRLHHTSHIYNVICCMNWIDTIGFSIVLHRVVALASFFGPKQRENGFIRI